MEGPVPLPWDGGSESGLRSRRQNRAAGSPCHWLPVQPFWLPTGLWETAVLHLGGDLENITATVPNSTL